MHLGRLLLRIVGWLLTPFVAWAASFLGAIIGALAAKAVSPGAGLALTALFGAVAGFTALWVVIHFLRSSPELRHALRVTKEGMPIATMDDIVDDDTAERPAS